MRIEVKLAARASRRFAPVVLAVAAAMEFATAAADAATSAPDWVHAAAAAAAPRSMPERTHAVVLFDETTMDISPKGLITRRDRVVFRILTHEGRSRAVAQAAYDTSADKIRSITAWAIQPSGKVTRFDRKKAIEAALYSTGLELYGERRVAVIDARGEVQPGGLFAYEIVREEKQVFSQLAYRMLWPDPLERGILLINLPPGWTLESRAFNSDAMSPMILGGSHRWEFRRQPAVAREEMAPVEFAYTPWLAIDIRRPAGTPGTELSWSFDTWRSISEHFTPHYEEAASVDESVRRKAAQRVAGAASRAEIVRRLCNFAQAVNYVSISLNSSAGHGMIPRLASRVLSCGYGDCKDKSSLLRALLASQGIASHAVIVYSGDSLRVQESWPSPMQFNHCIVAIEVDDSIAGPAVIQHEELGKLLMFDPTNTTAPLGILPAEVQGGLGLIVAGDRGGLVRLPVATPSDNHVVRRVQARIDESGGVTGSVRVELANNSSIAIRRALRFTATTQFREFIEKEMGGSLPGARVTRVDPVDNFDAASVTLDINFEAVGHGRVMRGEMIVFKPVLVARQRSIPPLPEKRRNPVVIEALSLEESTEIEIPADYAVDDLVGPVEIESRYGRYTSRVRVGEGGRLLFNRSFVQPPALLPPGEYDELRQFFDRIVHAEQSPVVLVKRPGKSDAAALE